MIIITLSYQTASSLENIQNILQGGAEISLQTQDCRTFINCQNGHFVLVLVGFGIVWIALNSLKQNQSMHYWLRGSMDKKGAKNWQK